MNEEIIEHFLRVVPLTDKEIRLIKEKIEFLKLNKKTHLLAAEEVCSSIYYIKRGCIRVYTMDDHCLENNIFFAIEDWWALDLMSFIEKTPARFYIETIEECEVWSISKPKFDLLLEEIPILEKWFRMLLQNALISSENRIHYKSSLKAEERYIKFLEKYPKLERRISQKHIASYLGISPEFLSLMKTKRLRKEKIE